MKLNCGIVGHMGQLLLDQAVGVGWGVVEMGGGGVSVFIFILSFISLNWCHGILAHK